MIKSFLIILFILFEYNLNAQQIVSPNNDKACDNKLFACGKTGLFFSVDKGKSWQRVATLPSFKVIKVYTRAMEVFVLTEKYGMYYSMDCGKTWESIIEVFKDSDEQVFKNVIILYSPFFFINKMG